MVYNSYNKGKKIITVLSMSFILPISRSVPDNGMEDLIWWLFK